MSINEKDKILKKAISITGQPEALFLTLISMLTMPDSWKIGNNRGDENVKSK